MSDSSESLPAFRLTDDGELPEGFPLPEPLPLDFDRESILSRVHQVNDRARRSLRGAPRLMLPLTLTVTSSVALGLLFVLVMLHFWAGR